jgi:phenylalanyl-tRNA synthetase alpha chain
MAAAETLASLLARALRDIGASTDLAALDEARVRFLGKKGALTEQLKSLGKLIAAERPAAGQKINDAKLRVQAAIDIRRVALEQEALTRDLAAGRFDVTLPGRGQ